MDVITRLAKHLDPRTPINDYQIRKLWNLKEEMCDAVLEELLATRILKRTPRNAYVLDTAAC
jgi:hypothetical protein